MLWMPLGTTMPNSPRWARIALASWVNCRTQKIPRPMAHQDRLLRLGLDRNEAHGRLHDRSADRLRISRISFATFDEGLT
ncbi:hypothetical protein ACFODY_06430 [Sinirhodobacter populi]